MNQAGKAGEPGIVAIKEHISRSAVVGFDESGCYCSKRLDRAWIAQPLYFTLLFRARRRVSKEPESRFGDSLKRMTAVTDRHSAYFTLHFLNHRVCLAHLLREQQYLNEQDGQQDCSREVETLFREAMYKRKENPQQVMDKLPWLNRLDRLLSKNLESLNPLFNKLKKGLIKCRDYLFNFLEVPFTLL